MRALDYPGTPAPAAGVVGADGGWTALEGAPVPQPLVAGRTCLLAVGSNRSPRVLHAKLHAAGAAGSVACVPYELTGLGVAHSAHVSPGGYVATTPYAATGAVVLVVASWFDAAQLAALDATEPNYDRRPLPPAVIGAPEGAQAYVSRWGLLAPDGVPLAATTQARVHAVLARDPVLAAMLPLPSPLATVEALRDRSTRDAVRRRFAALGWVRPPPRCPAHLGPPARPDSTSRPPTRPPPGEGGDFTP